MRSSIIFLLLTISFGLNAMQPPEQPKKMQISSQQFAQEAANKKSYLSLLPADIIEMVGTYTYPSLVDAIIRIRNRYLADQNNMQKFVTDEEFNQKIINDLAEKFNKPNRKALIAIMLNTPASFNIAYHDDMFKKSPLPNFRIFYFVFTDYINYASINCEDALNYTEMFIQNIKSFSNLLLEDYNKKYNDEIVQKAQEELVRKAEQELITDINRLLHLKFTELNKKEWTCVIQ